MNTRNVLHAPFPQNPSVKPPDSFEPFSPVKWHGRSAPAADWMVDGCFMRGTVAILAGDGGLGKTLICQQLMTAVALGKRWMGLRTCTARSLGVFCEDDKATLQRRQEAINRHYGCTMLDLDAMRMESMIDREFVLMRFPQWGGEGKRQRAFDQLEQAATAYKAQFIFLDTLSHVFSGNEVDRNQPHTFVRELRKLAVKIQGCVILTQHPSNEGLKSGSGASGSTGWHNSVRSRVYLTAATKKGEDERINERVLRLMKNNEGKRGTKIELVWDNGVFRPKEEQMSYWNDEQGWEAGF